MGPVQCSPVTDLATVHFDFWGSWESPLTSGLEGSQTQVIRGRTNLQQLARKMVWSFSFLSLLFLLREGLILRKATTNVQNGLVLFFLYDLKNAFIQRKILGKNSEKVWKSVEKCEKVWKSAETILPFSCCPLVFLWFLRDLEWVVSACARCQSNPSSTNFALTAPTKTPKLFCGKRSRSADLTVCWGVEFPLKWSDSTNHRDVSHDFYTHPHQI